MNYPRFYQKGSVCIKRESANTGKQVTIPEACRINNFGFKVLSTTDKLSFDALLLGMREVGFETYERYLIALHEFTKRQPSGFRETHQITPEYAGTTVRIPQ